MAGELHLVCIKNTTQPTVFIIFFLWINISEHHFCSLTNCPRMPEHRLLCSQEKLLFTAQVVGRPVKTRESWWDDPGWRSFTDTAAVRRIRDTHFKAWHCNLAFVGMYSHCLSRLLLLKRESKWACAVFTGTESLQNRFWSKHTQKDF